MAHHIELLGLVSCSAFAGLRPSEGCNVRRPDSPLGPGIIFSTTSGVVQKAEIDLRQEMRLRSDFVPIGKIKKERIQPVPDIFLDAFMTSYTLYMEYMRHTPYEAEYGPYSVNSRGKAISYASYREQFQRIIHDEVIPIFLSDNDPEVALYGRILLEHSLSPHIFRHWYSVQLVLSGVDATTLAFLRGDKSIESATTYIKNKGDLERKYRMVTDKTFDFLSWQAAAARISSSQTTTERGMND